MKVLITGGTGLIGRELVKEYRTHDIVLLTRDIQKAKHHLQHVPSDNLSFITQLSDLTDLNNFDVIINLAGEPIADKRWTKQQKSHICESRWSTTEKIVELIHASATPPHTFISGSAVGYYGDQQAHPFDESLTRTSGQFPYIVCSKWEAIAQKAQSNNTRVCLLRTGVVLSPSGGALKKMLPIYNLGLGGTIGFGKQYMPWIHIEDMTRAISFLLENPQAKGAFNLCAPHAVANATFSRTLAKELARPHFLMTPLWVFRLIIGESRCLVTDSIRAKPKRLTELGFNFKYSRIEPALKHLLQKE